MHAPARAPRWRPEPRASLAAHRARRGRSGRIAGPTGHAADRCGSRRGSHVDLFGDQGRPPRVGSPGRAHGAPSRDRAVRRVAGTSAHRARPTRRHGLQRILADCPSPRVLSTPEPRVRRLEGSPRPRAVGRAPTRGPRSHASRVSAVPTQRSGCRPARATTHTRGRHRGHGAHTAQWLPVQPLEVPLRNLGTQPAHCPRALSSKGRMWAEMRRSAPPCDSAFSVYAKADHPSCMLASIDAWFRDLRTLRCPASHGESLLRKLRGGATLRSSDAARTCSRTPRRPSRGHHSGRACRDPITGPARHNRFVDAFRYAGPPVEGRRPPTCSAP
jgi:hypothetical protein